MRHSIIALALIMMAFVIAILINPKLPTESKNTLFEPRISVITLGVSDLKESHRFYEALGLPTKMTPEEGGLVVFMTRGTRLSLYQYDKLAEDIGLDPDRNKWNPEAFRGITLAHTVRQRERVDEILALAEAAGGKIVKPAQDVFWGGYSGYFSDPDGILWEVNHSDAFKFASDGSISF